MGAPRRIDATVKRAAVDLQDVLVEYSQNVDAALARKTIFGRPTAVVTAASYTAQANEFVVVDSVTRAVTVRLPSIGSVDVGAVVTVLGLASGGGNEITIAAAAGDSIDGELNALRKLHARRAPIILIATAAKTWQSQQWLTGTSGIKALTASKTVDASEAGTTFTNEGATAAISLTLPTAEAGLEFKFIVIAAYSITVIAAASNTVRIGTSVSAAAGYVTSSTLAGTTIHFVAINSTQWVAQSSSGTWTVD